DARQIREKALGNLAWAYYKMGDFDKSLALYLEAIEGARDLGVVIDQIRWLNNLGLVYYQINQLSVAEDYYRKSLALAQKSKNSEQVFDALTALAFVSVQKGQWDEAKQYSEQALRLAQVGNDHPAELYPILVQGEIATGTRDIERAERIFLEVARD